MDLLIDLQGFSRPKGSNPPFVLKELAVASPEPLGHIDHWVFTTPLELRDGDLSYRYVRNSHHMLDYEDGDVPYDKIPDIFRRIFSGYTKVVYVKGLEKKRWIQHYFKGPAHIVDLDDYPSLNGAEYAHQPGCTFNHPKCAMSNVLKLMGYMLAEDTDRVRGEHAYFFLPLSLALSLHSRFL